MDVPGCEPYREYLYTYLREQPVWQSLRFWNAAIFDALHCERVRSILPTVAVEDRRDRRSAGSATSTAAAAAADAQKADSCDEDEDASLSGHSAADGGAAGDDEDDADDDLESVSEMRSGCRGRADVGRRPLDRRAEETKMHQNISFGQLG